MKAYLANILLKKKNYCNIKIVILLNETNNKITFPLNVKLVPEEGLFATCA